MVEEMRHAGSELGNRAQKAVVRYLDQMDYEVIEEDWTCPAGVIDLIALHEGTLVFIEVLVRIGIERGFPPEESDEIRRVRFERVASWYLKDSERVDIPIEFDAVHMLVVGENRAFIKHYRGACTRGI